MVKGILVNRKSDETLKSQLKMEHADLIAEMQTVENLPTHERLQLARLRRTQQLKVARQKEKEWVKLQRAKGNAYALSASNHSSTTHHFRGNGGGGSIGNRHISFENSVVLLEAASRNDMQEVQELLERGITPDAANEDGLTALHQCCIDNNVEMLKLLLEYGARVDAQDSDKWTPLHAAATCGHLDLVRILIDHGANLLAVNTDGNMPYDLCDDENTLDFIEAEMSKRGVTQELIDETRSSTEHRMLKDLTEVARTGGDLEEPDYQGATPLHIAAANGYVRVVEFLLEMHVNVDALDKDMWSPVHAAACWGHLEVLEMLAQCGADLNVKNKDDETPTDICEDPEIRERIEQLKTEQESKRLAEAQRRRVRRSQSNNTRAQSVRRTSLRDKTLTTKKDAVEEARLRLQAQEVFIAGPDGSTPDQQPNGSSESANVAAELLNGLPWLAPNGNSSINNNNDEKSYQASLALNGSGGGGASSGSGALLTHSMSVDAVDSNALTGTTNTLHSSTAATMSSASYVTRRPPDGRENDELQLYNYKSGVGESMPRGSTGSSTATAVFMADRNVINATGAGVGVGNSLTAEALQIQSSKEAANGKINVQVTVLVDTSNTHHHHHQQLQQQQQQQHNHLHHHQQQQQQQQLINNIALSTLHLDAGNAISNNNNNNNNNNNPNSIVNCITSSPHHHNPGIYTAAATLANLKKQRSLSRSNVLNQCENGTVLGAATTTTTTTNSTTNNNNNNNNIAHIPNNSNNSNSNNNNSNSHSMHTLIGNNDAISHQPTSAGMHPMHMDYNNVNMTTTADSSSAAATSASASSVNKFSGITGEVVDDTTSSSRKCCTLM